MAPCLQNMRTMETKQSADVQRSFIPGGQLLEGFVKEALSDQSIWIPSLEAGTRFVVQTRHTRYQFEVLDPKKCSLLVEGGSLFQEPTTVRLQGATAGGSSIKSGWIVAGLRVELLTHEHQGVITSAVDSLSIE